MPITASHLREDVYNILDAVLASGEPVEVVRKGRILRIIAEQPATGQPSSKLARLRKRDCIVGDPEDLVETDWSGEWTPHI